MAFYKFSVTGPGSRISSENMKIIINNAGYEADS
jgi:hypothetical protein